MSNRLALGLVPLLPLLVTACSEAPEQALANRLPMLKQYCTDCHNDAERTGDMSLEHVTTADVTSNPKRWEEVVRRLRGSLMPPPGNPHPNIDQAKQFVAAVESNLDAAAATRGAAPGRTLLHRLNRVEYATFAAVYFLAEIPLLLGLVAAYRWWERMPGALSRLGRVAP